MKFTVADMIAELQKNYPQDAEILQPGDHGAYHFLGAGSLGMAVLLNDNGDSPYENSVGGEDHYSGENPEDFNTWRRVLVIAS